MLSPELSDQEVASMVDSAQARLTGANMRLAETERAQENIQRELDECRTARAAARRLLEDANELQKLRGGIPHIVAEYRKETADLWRNCGENGDMGARHMLKARRRIDFLAQMMRRCCPHPHVIESADRPDSTSPTDSRECVICHKREQRAWYAQNTHAELRDMPGRQVVTLRHQEFETVAGEFCEMPDCDAIVARYDSLRTPKTPG